MKLSLSFPFFDDPTSIDNLMMTLLLKLKTCSNPLAYQSFDFTIGMVIFLPSNVICVNLAQSSEVKPWKHQGSQTSFLLLDSCWHAFCQDQKVLAYVHSSGSICLHTEVVCHLNVYGSSLKIGRFHIHKSLISWSYSPGQTVAIGLTGWVFEVLGVTEGLGVIYLYINADLMQILFTP